MTSAEIALALFALCNSVRVFAYVPQIVAVARDPCGASAISYATWGLFAVSHLSTVAYAVLVVADWRMAAVFVANTICCLVIVGLTAWKRALFKTAQQLLATSKLPTLHTVPTQESRSGPLDASRLQYRIVQGGKDGPT
jgi:hypothetical protein